ncbi:MAG: hypothetical protein U9N39_03855 [Campylobacterota bacterium]|nr:hypothetical protein [Campylobacterota bacterium]
MNKPPFSRKKADRVATVSNQIEGYEPVQDKTILKKIKKLKMSDKV